jgi:iron complex outermembrane receptor protein
MFDNITGYCRMGKGHLMPVLFILSYIQGWSQTADTSGYAKPKALDEIIVTATRKSENLSRVAYYTTVLTRKDIQQIPASSFDDIFSVVAGINQDRKNGIFSGSKNTLNLMGITGGEQGRVLVLEDGTPLNVSDNGEVNWNRLNLQEYERIEIIKGPASSLYGSNAMGGIINLVSSMPRKPFRLKAGISYGSYNTIMGSCGLEGKNNRFYWKAAVNYNRSDGYVMPPDSLRDSTDVATFLSEGGVRLHAGYQFSDFFTVDASYSFYDDKHGYGLKILDADGGYSSHKTHYGRLGTSFDNTKWFFALNLFYQQEDYTKFIEKLKGTAYSAIDATSGRSDAGLFTFAGKRFGNIVVSLGADLRTGSTNGADIYRTSTDIVRNKGRLSQFSAHIHAESDLFTSRIKAAGALYYSVVSMNDASFSLENPTEETSYMEEFAGVLNDTVWTALNPSFSLMFCPSEKVTVRLIYSHGFRTPAMDDLTRSGMINIGFKEASPLLRPEKINNYQLAVNAPILPSLALVSSVYYLDGYDYIYYIETGETLFGGKRKVYRKDNLNEVRAIGGEAGLQWYPARWLHAYTNLSLSRSVIHRNEILEGKVLSYSPGHMERAGIITENKFLDGSVHVIYTGKQYMDDQNETFIPAHGIVNLYLSRIFADHFKVSLTIQNMTNKTYIYDGRNRTLGRFITGGFELLL